MPRMRSARWTLPPFIGHHPVKCKLSPYVEPPKE